MTRDLIFFIALEIAVIALVTGSVAFSLWVALVNPTIIRLHGDIVGTLTSQNTAQQKVVSLEQEIRSIQAQNMKDRETFREGIRQFIDETQKTNEEATRRLDAALDQIAEKDTQIGELNRTLEAIQERNRQADGERQTLVAQVDQLTESNKKLTDELREVQAQYNTLQDSHNNLGKLMENQLQSHEKTISTMNDKFKEQIDGLQDQIVEATQRLVEQRAMLNNAKLFLKHMGLDDEVINQILNGDLDWPDVKDRVIERAILHDRKETTNVQPTAGSSATGTQDSHRDADPESPQQPQGDHRDLRPGNVHPESGRPAVDGVPGANPGDPGAHPGINRDTDDARRHREGGEAAAVTTASGN
jgi:hypothetical protein